MKEFIVENSFWTRFPEAKIGVVVCHDIKNDDREHDKYKSLLTEAEKNVANHLLLPEFSSNPVIKSWRETFLKFKTKKGARSSIEALLKRVHKGGSLNSINPLVDIYNTISLKYALPCGGEDIETFVGDLKLTLAEGGEDFIPLGSDESSPPYEGEVIYKDDLGAVCRCWNWREAVRTMLTEKTTHAFMCVELVDLDRLDVFNAALVELSSLVKLHLGGNTQLHIIDKNNPSVVIEN